MLYLPTVYYLRDYYLVKFIQTHVEAKKLWLFKNGDQILVQTYDGMLHRMNIKENDEHSVIDKKNFLLFVLSNSGREYLIRNKDCVKIDYDLIDKVLKGISIDTTKSQGLYNRLLYRQ